MVGVRLACAFGATVHGNRPRGALTRQVPRSVLGASGARAFHGLAAYSRSVLATNKHFGAMPSFGTPVLVFFQNRHT
jgi:hypothetical protein